MASPLSSAGTSTQARLSLRSDPACLFMTILPSLKFVIASEAKQSRVAFAARVAGIASSRCALLAMTAGVQAIGMFARGNAEGYAQGQGGPAHDRDASSIDGWLAGGGVGAAGRGAAQPVAADHHRG